MKELTNRDEEWRKLKNSNISYAILSLMAFFILAGVLTLHFEQDMKIFTQWIAVNFGLPGMCAVVYLADALVSPIPPDTMLLVVAKSEMSQNWFYYVSIFSVLSVLGGNTGYWIGHLMRKWSWIPPRILNYSSKKQELVQKFGHWVVVLGAMTPLPFSLSCWGAGMVRLNYSHFFLASLFRIPRIFGAYYLIFHSKSLADLISNYL